MEAEQSKSKALLLLASRYFATAVGEQSSEQAIKHIVHTFARTSERSERVLGVLRGLNSTFGGGRKTRDGKRREAALWAFDGGVTAFAGEMRTTNHTANERAFKRQRRANSKKSSFFELKNRKTTEQKRSSESASLVRGARSELA